MKKIFMLALGLSMLLAAGARAQSYPVPTDYVLKEKTDYAKYNEAIIKTIDWLQQTPWADQPDQRKAANAFLIAWLTGSPDVSIELGSGAIKLCDKNKELLIIFMGGYAKYVMQHPGAFTKDQANAAGVQAVLAKYQSQTDHVQDGMLEDVLKIQQQGKLDAWVTTEFNKS